MNTLKKSLTALLLMGIVAPAVAFADVDVAEAAKGKTKNPRATLDNSWKSHNSSRGEGRIDKKRDPRKPKPTPGPRDGGDGD